MKAVTLDDTFIAMCQTQKEVEKIELRRERARKQAKDERVWEIFSGVAMSGMTLFFILLGAGII